LLGWTTLNTFFAFDPSFSWPYWDRAWKTIAMCIFAATLATNRVRLHAIMLIIALSLAYYGVKGGIFTIETGGNFHVLGPPGSMLEDNNELGLALVMVLPIFHYLRSYSSSPGVRAGLLVAILLCIVSVLGSYSRESYIALGVLVVTFWWHSTRKLLYPIFAGVFFIATLYFLPESIYERAASILDFKTDASFQSRLDSWWVAYRYAMDHAPFGAGFYGLNLPGVWNLYIPGNMHAAHSIYFQALGEQGIVGLILYIVAILLGFANFTAVIKRTRRIMGLEWANDLAKAMRLGLLAFCVGGAAAPMAFFDLLFLWIALSATLVTLVQRQIAPARRQTTTRYLAAAASAG
jgi:probable O-glycosylation ligase (exosortase A-associated)